jgi:hypothetical protein
MTTPTPTPVSNSDVQGPLVRQPAVAAALARVLAHAADELYDAATLTDADWMWEEARAIASRILASCPTS